MNGSVNRSGLFKSAKAVGWSGIVIAMHPSTCSAFSTRSSRRGNALFRFVVRHGSRATEGGQAFQASGSVLGAPKRTDARSASWVRMSR